MNLSLTLRIIAVLAVFVVSTGLFWLAAETLNPTKLNLINVIYYSYMVFSYVGSAAVFLGFRGHHQMLKIRDPMVFDKGYFYIALLGILFPLVVILVRKLLSYLFQVRPFADFMDQPLDMEKNRDQMQWNILLGIFLLCLVITCLFYIRARQIPLLPWFNGQASLRLRQVLGKTRYINPYLKNIFMIQLPAYLSFFVYVKARKTGFFRWTLLFIAYGLLAIVTKTYDFQKSPVIVYLLCFFFIEVYIGRVRVGGLLLAGAGALGLILGMYLFVFNYSGSLFNLYSGPASRIIFSQVAGFFHSINIFPGRYGFLGGESLPTLLTKILGIGRSWNRSSVVIMNIMNPVHVLNGTAGVMNSVFIAEAYANWGVEGIVGSIVYVATLFSTIHTVFLSQKKTAGSIALYVSLAWIFATAFQGGFVDFVYNASIIILFALFFAIHLVSGWGIQKSTTIGRTSWIRE